MTVRILSLAVPAASTLALAAGLMVADSKPAHACSQEDYIGSVCYMLGNFCPRGYLPAEGQLVTINQYQALYSLFGTTYGGDGRTTFGLPDLRGRTVVGYGQGMGLPVNIPWGMKRGAETAQLGLAQLPSHNHAVTVTGTPTVNVGGAIAVATGNGTQSTVTPGQTVYPAGLEIVDGDGNITYSGPYTATTPTNPAIMPVNIAGNVSLSGVSTANTGGGQAFSIIPPQLAVTACIMNTGLYPPRP